MKRAVFNWSGGKDSTLALHALHELEGFDVITLLTTMTGDYDRISIHGVRRTLLENQAAAIGIPLQMAFIPPACSNQDYESAMHDALCTHRAQGIEHVVAGDIFLQDVKEYRDRLYAGAGMTGIYPIWGLPSSKLAKRFISLGYKAIVTCVDTQALDASFAGRFYDADFLADLPSGIDGCGENGEFHTFTFDGPLFHEPVRFTIGERVLRDGRFCFQDLLPIADDSRSAGEPFSSAS
jgi:uncharacterized protein (TIGR00290 family)